MSSLEVTHYPLTEEQIRGLTLSDEAARRFLALSQDQRRAEEKARTESLFARWGGLLRRLVD